MTTEPPTTAVRSPYPLPIAPEPSGRIVTAGRHGYHVITMGRAGEGTAPAVFLHGGGPGCSAWTDFGPTAELFARHRQCHFVDLLQYGKSDKSPIEGPRWTYLAASLVELLDALGVDRADVVCNSWGGTIGIALAADHPGRVRSLVVTGSMPVFYGPLAPLPEGGRRGRNVRDRYFGGEGPTLDKMRELMASLEWYDATLIPDETVQRRYEQSLDAGEMHLAASSDSLRGEWQDLESTPAGDPLPHAVRLGHARRLPHARLPADARPHGAPRPAVRDGCDVAPPAGGAAVGLRGDGRGLPRPVGAARQ